jgi:hypothetical protein
MTAGSEESALAGQAQTAGEVESQAWMAHAESMQASIAGSQVDTSDGGRSPEDGGVPGWTGS